MKLLFSLILLNVMIFTCANSSAPDSGEKTDRLANITASFMDVPEKCCECSGADCFSLKLERQLGLERVVDNVLVSSEAVLVDALKEKAVSLLDPDETEVNPLERFKYLRDRKLVDSGATCLYELILNPDTMSFLRRKNLVGKLGELVNKNLYPTILNCDEMSKSPLISLPAGVPSLIFEYLKYKDVARISITCKQARNISCEYLGTARCLFSFRKILLETYHEPGLAVQRFAHAITYMIYDYKLLEKQRQRLDHYLMQGFKVAGSQGDSEENTEEGDVSSQDENSDSGNSWGASSGSRGQQMRRLTCIQLKWGQLENVLNPPEPFFRQQLCPTWGLLLFNTDSIMA